MDLRAERGDLPSVAAGPLACPAISAGVYGWPVEAALSG
jgi:hypothetical protein